MRTRILSSLAIALTVWGATPASGQEAPRPAAETPAPPVPAQIGPRIASRDQVKVTVFNAGAKEEAYSGTYAVDADGQFEYPSVGRIKAAGLTPRQLEADVLKRLQDIMVSPQVSIEVTQTGDKKIVLNGEVRAPGEYNFSGDTTLFAMLTRAGSLTETAGEEAIIHRMSTDPSAPAETIRVDLAEMMTGQSMRNDISLRAGDVIVVPKSEPVYIYGFVQSTGAIYVGRNATVKQVLARAGGVTDRGSTRGITIRRVVDGKPKDIPVKDMESDIVLPGDIITVRARLF